MAIKEYYNPSSGDQFDSLRGTWKWQTFVAASSYTIGEIILKLFRAADAGHRQYFVRLFAVDIAHKPTGLALVTMGSFYSDELTTSYVDYGFSDDTYALVNTTEYAIVVQTDDEYTTNEWSWYTDDSAGYATGYCGYGNHTGWAIISNDRWFENYEAVAVPTKTENPTPSDTATSVDFSALGLSWDDGGGADTFDVYMGPVGALVLVSSAQAETTFTVDTATVPWGETIYWRVDATNTEGTTTGDTWSFSVVNINSIWMGTGGNFIVVSADDGVFLSTDFGANWTRKTPDAVETTDWTKGICSSTGTYIIVVSSVSAIYRSANSGTAWAAITPAGGDTFSVNDLATSDDGQFMGIVGQNSTTATKSCYISTDYGATWTVKYPVAGNITYTECDISNDGTVIAVSTTANFYISLDSGATWLEQGMASSAEVWAGLSISGDGAYGIVANTNNNNEVFVGVKTDLYSEATWAESSLTSAGRAILDDADAAAQAVTLGLEIGVDTQAWDAQLDDIAALAVTNGNFMVGDGSNWIVESGDTARVSLGVGTTDSPVFAGITTTGTIDASAGKVLVTDNDTSEPSGESDGYIGVSIIDGTARVYFTVSGTMYYVDGTVVAAAEIVTGNPIGLLLALTYNIP